ncbi:PREDICTED: uncharacterized protein LOC108748138 [Trachymyrmex septentrionalis]|uniref:uncharacterized protein LOC108748138 n=1 Tax=Trachymyrmex septentrionalis TaxID=34720 RepID=UPI00084ED1EA|nr:PREDICTED: uncharacterized protein LOC108748138 [Trachymyrmex septentrionalis]
MRAIVTKANISPVLLPLIIEPEAEMLPVGYKGVKPPGVTHMELAFAKPQTSPSRISAASMTDDGNSGKSNRFNQDNDAHYAASKYETQVARDDHGTDSLAVFGVGSKGDAKKQNEKVEHSEVSGESKSHSENEDRAKNHKEEVAKKKGAIYETRDGHERARNTAGYRNVYHKDEFKKDADFYSNGHRGGHFKNHGRYGEKHAAAEGKYAKGRNNDSRFDQSIYKPRLALPEDFDNVMTFMCDAFYKDDPTMVNIGLNKQEPASSLLQIMYNEIREGMTLIVEEEEDECIVGAVVNAGSCPWDPDKFVEFARCCECGPARDVIEFDAYVTGKPNLWERYCVLKIFECSYLAVRPDFRNRGIARKLVLDSWYLARDCGYRLFRIDCNNRYIARIAEGFGWKQVCIIPFHEYVRDGQRVFQHIKEPHTDVQIYVDQVLFCKDYCPPYKTCEKITSAPNNLTCSERLLIITPTPSYSHQIVFRVICLALNKRGHEIVTLTPNILNDTSITNYTEIDFGFIYEKIDDTDMSQTRWNLTQLAGLKTRLLTLGHNIAEDALSHPDLAKYYTNRSDMQFDAVIAEMIMTPAIYMLAHRFNAPLIGIMSMDLQNCHRFTLGSPVLPSHSSNWELENLTGLNLPFWRRLINFINTWWSIHSWFNNFAIKQQKIAEKYFGNNIPRITDVAKNMSLVLINQEPLLAYARPEIPNIVHFSGLHIAKKPPSLPKNLKEFLDSATNGFIYMSLGSNTKSKLLPKKILDTFANTFANLSYKILWKFENDSYHVPPNVFISKWIPQQGVLAHPNIKLFIYQGGLQSTEEAVHYAVPLIGIPFVFDQVYQVMKMVSLGVARYLDIVRLTGSELYDAIIEVINDKGYKDRMLALRALTKDKPYDSLENVIWWIEFVMRHNGAPHLRFNGVDIAWYQQFDLDVIVFLTITLFLVLCTILAIVGWASKKLYNTHYNDISNRYVWFKNKIKSE